MKLNRRTIRYLNGLPAVRGVRDGRIRYNPGACVHEWVKRKHPLEWDLVAHIIPTLDPNGHAAYSIADHVIHVPDDMIRMLPRTFAYRIREAAEAQVEADRLMSVFADPHGETARRMMRETAD